MRRDIVGSVVAIVVLTIGLGLVYPLVMTGVAQVTFNDQANGSQVERDGKVVGSHLIGQDFRKPVLDASGQPKMDEDGNPVLEADPAWFQSRPSQSGYSANVTFFSNLGPNQKDLADQVKANLDGYLALERPFTPGLTAGWRAGRRRHRLRLGGRPAHLGRERPHPGQPHRRGAQGATRPGAGAGPPADRRACAGGARRAGRERARPEPGR